jgi:hypothetical protein
MSEFSTEIAKNTAKKVVDNWDNSGLAFLFALLGATAFCFASLFSNDWLAPYLQLFGISVLWLMMVRLPIYYVASERGISDKSSASLGLTACFAILSFMLSVSTFERTPLYYFALGITLTFALLMVWRMNMSDSRVNVRKTFTASTVIILVQCVFSALLLTEPKVEHPSKTWLQLNTMSALLLVCIWRLVTFLRQRSRIEVKLGIQLDLVPHNAVEPHHKGEA